MLENYNVIDLISDKSLGKKGKYIYGLYVWNCEEKKVEIILVKFVVFVIGGVSKVYLYIFNFDVLSGDGIVMVWCVGCWVVNMEFN